MEYLNGKNLQKKLLEDIKKVVFLLTIKPTLAVISLGENQVNDIFFKQIKKMCTTVGYEVVYHHYEEISLPTLLNLIQTLNKDPSITSIMIEMPILKELPLKQVRNAILPQKDIEGITDTNRLKCQNKEGGFLPSVVLGTIMLLEEYQLNIQKQNVVIINRSDLIGKPLARFFLENDCTVTICHSQTENLEYYVKNADIVITAVGKPHFLKEKIFKQDTIVIDIGINYLKGRLCGDVELSNEQEQKIKFFAKSIGGVGPMTITALAHNILKSYYLTQKDKENF